MNAETNLTGSNKFPVKLYNILQEAEKSPYLADIVSWTPDGRSFKVHKKDEFSKVVLPTTFGTNVYKSYQRNLHFWGFQNIRKGSEKGICSHPHFIKGQPELLCKMHRVRAPRKTSDEAIHGGFGEDRTPERVPSTEVPQGGHIPSFIYAGAPMQGRTVSPSLTSNNSNASNQSLTGLMDPNLNPSSLLLLLRQQQESILQQHLLKQQQQQQHQQLQLNSQPQQLTESLVFQHLLAQQQQEQQQRNLQELLANSLGHTNNPIPSSSAGLDQRVMMQNLMAQLLQQQPAAGNVSDVNSALLAGLLR